MLHSPQIVNTSIFYIQLSGGLPFADLSVRAVAADAQHELGGSLKFVQDVDR